jgi:hypothetical protein
MADSIAALAQELMKREVMERPAQFNRPSSGIDLGLNPAIDVEPINPELGAVVGGLADAASTFSFLKRGTGKEGNAMWNGAKNSPGKTAAGVAASSLAAAGLRHLLRKKGHGKLADLIAGIMGGQQVGLAAQNAHHDSRGGFNSSSQRDVDTKVNAAITQRGQ